MTKNDYTGLAPLLPNLQNKQDIFSVTKLNRLVKRILNTELGSIWVSAEISNLTMHGSGHWYFTLKDDKAQIRAAMFKGSNRSVTFRPKEGDKVLVNGNLSLYEPRGDYQLIVEKMEPEGLGQLKQAFEELKQRLFREGLFNQDKKQQIPQSPQTVGVITSATGAALHDMLTVFSRRSPQTRIILYPSSVQGADAPQQLQSALQKALQRNEVDVIILGRGGGSLEDLWCFNDEALARDVFSSPIPIISAVGHEVDVTICDFVADHRAPTPSAAAEIASSDARILHQQLTVKHAQLIKSFSSYVNGHRQRLNNIQYRLKVNSPQARLQQQNQRLDFLSSQLTNLLKQQLENKLNHHQRLSMQLQSYSPVDKITEKQTHLTTLNQRLSNSVKQCLNKKYQQWQLQSQLLDSVSPLATLNRGYSISVLGDELITKTRQVEVGAILTTKLSDGEIMSKVENIKRAVK